MEISERLQKQITWLCNQVPDDEWSGTLFFTVKEGSLDEDKCTLLAEYVYLQDIGTAAYTEYSFQSDFTTFLMKNPEFMDMTMGHIHSHNKMPVFFSGTDDDELITNSEFYNHYLSLIVNNNNDTTAKVAFRFTQTMSISSTIKKRNSKGEFVTEDVEPLSEDVQVTGFYDCEVKTPEVEVYSELADRFKVVKVERSEKRTSFSNTHTSKTGTSGKGGINTTGSGKKFEQNKAWLALEDQEDNWGWNQRGSQGDLFEEGMVARHEKPGKVGRTSGTEVSRINPDVNRFITRLVALDYNYLGTLGSALKNQEDRMRSLHEILLYGEEVGSRLMDFYMKEFPDDKEMDQIELRVRTGVAHINASYGENFPELISELTDTLLYQVRSSGQQAAL